MARPLKHVTDRGPEPRLPLRVCSSRSLDVTVKQANTYMCRESRAADDERYDSLVEDAGYLPKQARPFSAAMVPRGGLKQLFTVRCIGCPTLPKRCIEFQGVFSSLSHRRRPGQSRQSWHEPLAGRSEPADILNLAVGRGVISNLQPKRYGRGYFTGNAGKTSGFHHLSQRMFTMSVG